ncbi:hypothetical protein HU200_050851 [Digitaria exilis]|uniref:Vacuolar ATPase assembly integral membrane protein VMA21 homolog n=1 Tax=Digitaria exilis TaxID=1010633 RepID=A0A835AT29_9POAL|nr:hypothetical protein HU200_050851 [Digitaria exilis]
MSGVITKFAVASMVMWMAPVAIVYGFYYQMFPGSAAVPVLIVYCMMYSIHILCSNEAYKVVFGNLSFFSRCSGVSQMSSSAQTLASGFLAVISVNLVIGFYICMAMKETPHQEPQPDPTFLANAKASINQPTSSQVSDDSKGKGKVE